MHTTPTCRCHAAQAPPEWQTGDDAAILSIHITCVYLAQKVRLASQYVTVGSTLSMLILSTPSMLSIHITCLYLAQKVRMV